MKTLGTIVMAMGLASAANAQSEDVLNLRRELERLDNQFKAAATGLNRQTVEFVSGQLVSGPPVKGAPYSAEAVNETVQLLADGNRIVRRTSAMQYRDNDGRERREETSAMGAIFITDPVTNTRYTLHPETKSAERGPMPVIRISPSVAGNVFAYSSSQPLVLEGTVTEMQWTNPTASITLSVKRPDAGTANWKCAMSAPNALVQLGWTRNTLKVGDAITVKGLPATEGENTCVTESVTLADGTTMAARQQGPAGIALAADNVSVAIAGAGGRSGAPRGGVSQGFTIATAERRVAGPGDSQTEQLGRMFIEGVQAEGTRTTTTIPAGEIGNERPINIVNERWYSPDLQMTILTKHSDPRSGETNFQLKNINRSSPPPYLFEVPSDYTVNSGGRGGRSGGPVPPNRVPEPPKK